MNRLHIPNEFVEWVFIILGVTVAALVGAGIKTWLDSALNGSAVASWAPGIAALVVFFVLATPFYWWASRSAKTRGEPSGSQTPDDESDE